MILYPELWTFEPMLKESGNELHRSMALIPHILTVEVPVAHLAQALPEVGPSRMLLD